jgi:hypothetical protein
MAVFMVLAIASNGLAQEGLEPLKPLKPVEPDTAPPFSKQEDVEFEEGLMETYTGIFDASGENVMQENAVVISDTIWKIAPSASVPKYKSGAKVEFKVNEKNEIVEIRRLR